MYNIITKLFYHLFWRPETYEVNMATSDSKLSSSLHMPLLDSCCTKMAEILLWPFVIQTWLYREKEGLRKL